MCVPRRWGRSPCSKLFTKGQRAFFTEHAPEGIELDDLSILGPMNVLKLKFAPKGFGRRLVAELWLYPDGTRILELSTKCLPAETFQVAAEAKAFLGDSGRRSERRAADEDRDGAQVLLRRAAQRLITRKLRCRQLQRAAQSGCHG